MSTLIPPGRLTVDGQFVPPATLRALVNDAAVTACPSMKDGAALACHSSDPLTLLVTVLAARVLRVPVLLEGPLATGKSTAALSVDQRPLVGAELRIANGEIQVLDHSDVGAIPLAPDVAAVLWTSGSSGEPKAVLHSSGALAYQTAATAGRLGIGESDEMLLPLPLNHAYGYSVLLLWAATGATLHLHSGFRPDAIADALVSHRITTLDGVPSSWSALANLARAVPDFRDTLSALRLRNCGGDVLPPALANRFLATVGAPLLDGYGLTEAGPNVAVSAPELYRPGSVGPPLEGTETRVTEAGELEVRSPSVMLGYFAGSRCHDVSKREEEDTPITAEGWLRTGDLATLDEDGFVYILGRSKNTVVVHGETLSPAVIEEALQSCPQVLAAGVVGVASGDVSGDTVVAFVSFTPGCDESTAINQLYEICRSALPPQFRPRVVVSLAALPRLSSHKVDRKVLRSHARNLLARYTTRGAAAPLHISEGTCCE